MLRQNKQQEAAARERELRAQLESMRPSKDPDGFDAMFQAWLDAVEEKQRYG